MQLPDLDNLLEYKNQRVIDCFKRNHPSKSAYAEDLFSDMLKYLWLSRKHADDQEQYPTEDAFDFHCVMHLEMMDIDNMWHTFILYTKDYNDFCQHYFGVYLHHAPDVLEDNPQTEGNFLKELNRYLAFAFDHLGADTLKRWFHVAI